MSCNRVKYIFSGIRRKPTNSFHSLFLRRFKNRDQQMKCYICYRLKLERRIPKVRNASMVASGVSVCDTHAGLIRIDTNVLGVLEVARDNLRAWWTVAENKFGVFNESTQLFADGKRYLEAVYQLERKP